MQVFSSGILAPVHADKDYLINQDRVNPSVPSRLCDCITAGAALHQSGQPAALRQAVRHHAGV